jgi:isocitrate dehydrogenase
MSSNISIAVAHGDGIGPEIMAACLHILDETGARIEIETIQIGEQVLDHLQKSGLDFIKIENLYTFDGQKGFVASQGE